MKLQIKDAGAWRNVVKFGEEQREEVMEAARQLLIGIGQPKIVMRIELDGKEMARCESEGRIARWTES